MSPCQSVIDRILDGPPYDLGEVEDRQLSLWLQAVRWLDAPDELQGRHGKIIPEVLAEKADRSASSPLAIYDAWLLNESGETSQAREIFGLVGCAGSSHSRVTGKPVTILTAAILTAAVQGGRSSLRSNDHDD